MARVLNRLTARGVSAMKAPGLHPDGGGLYLKVDASGAKRWAFVFRFDGARREMGLGGTTVIDLAEARGAAAEARKLVAKKIDPIAARKEVVKPEADGQTFGEFAAGIVAGMVKRDGTIKVWDQTVRLYLGDLAGMAPADIGTTDIVSLLKPICARAPSSASRARAHIEYFLDAARVAGLREGENPARWRGHLALLLPPAPKLIRGHYTAISAPEMKPLIRDLRKQRAICARVAEYAILTVSRLNEAVGARWDEIDEVARCWTVPPERMKTGSEHRVALSDGALAVLKEMAPARAVSPFVFPATDRSKPITDRGVTHSLARVKGFDCTMHGFRSTFRDWVDDHTDYSGDLAEVALSHAVGSQVERAYRRGDMFEKRLPLMNDWSAYCLGA